MRYWSAPDRTPHAMPETVEKDHGRIETRRCYAFDQLACLHKPEQWPDLKSFAVIESQREIKGKTTLEHRYYLSSLAPDANRLLRAIRAHWSIEHGSRLSPPFMAETSETKRNREPKAPQYRIEKSPAFRQG